MRAMDCVHKDHEDMHFTAANDDELLQRISDHRDQYHPEMTDDQIRELVSANAHDE